MPVSWAWLSGPTRVEVTFSGTLQTGSLNAASWFVRRSNESWTGMTVSASGNKVTAQVGFVSTNVGADQASYDGVAGDLKASDGTPLAAFDFFG